MTAEQAKEKLADIWKQMQDVTVLHKQEMRRLTDEIRKVQEQCRHPGDWWDRCPACGHSKGGAA